MNRNRFTAERYVIDFMSQGPKTGEQIREFFQNIIDNTITLTCDEVRSYVNTNINGRKQNETLNVTLEIEAALEYLDTRIEDCPDQLKLNL